MPIGTVQGSRRERVVGEEREEYEEMVGDGDGGCMVWVAMRGSRLLSLHSGLL